uniref:Hypothetical LAGLIDADG homing endonuclease n=1 Tax=Ourococcus multisporus TaxID=132186 RepID=A0A076VFM6_9CHLO|nr:hypothetical LAGLIDADG homing endonuclease [Ourococcus multisporus]AIK29172.1 hypothetical LAGLIDADG homing endonuclease [Ourococcus multisporus]
MLCEREARSAALPYFLKTAFSTFFRKNFSIQAQVETPEAVCAPTNLKNKKLNKKIKSLRWSQWLAGLIDGNGCFLVSKAGYISLEITISSKDEALLPQIQNKYGGSLKARAGLNAVRYRLHDKGNIIKLCVDVNGFIRHPVRLQQFTKVCNKLCLEVKSPDLLNKNHGWFAGMFDADGCITFNLSGKFPQITVSVTQKYKEIPLAFKKVFKGSLYYDKSKNGYWSWAVQSKESVLEIINYFKKFPCRSSRRQKLFLTPKVYNLLQDKAYLPQTSQLHLPTLHKKWLKLLLAWKAL